MTKDAEGGRFSKVEGSGDDKEEEGPPILENPTTQGLPWHEMM
jgi:hypothetical protein